MIVKLLTEHNLEFLSLKGGCRGSSESTLVKMPHCWKSHVRAQMVMVNKMSLVYKLSDLTMSPIKAKAWVKIVIPGLNPFCLTSCKQIRDHFKNSQS